MRVRSPRAFSHVAPLGRPVEAGETVEVDDQLGAQLCAQGWEPARKRSRTATDSPDEGTTTTTAPAAALIEE